MNIQPLPLSKFHKPWFLGQINNRWVCIATNANSHPGVGDRSTVVVEPGRRLFRVDLTRDDTNNRTRNRIVQVDGDVLVFAHHQRRPGIHVPLDDLDAVRINPQTGNLTQCSFSFNQNKIATHGWDLEATVEAGMYHHSTKNLAVFTPRKLSQETFILLYGKKVRKCDMLALTDRSRTKFIQLNNDPRFKEIMLPRISPDGLTAAVIGQVMRTEYESEHFLVTLDLDFMG